VDVPPDEMGEAAERGTAVHRVAAGESFEEVAATYGYDTEELAELVAVWREWWPRFVESGFGGVVTEVAAVCADTEKPYAYDVASGLSRVLPSEGERDYSKATATEVPGTVDVVVVAAADGLVITIDLKTGKPPKTLREYREQVEHNALCAADVAGVSRAIVMIAHITPAGVEVDVAHLGPLELAEVAESLATTVASVPTAEPRPGPWCFEKWCPALTVCPVAQWPLAMVPSVRRLPLVGEVRSDEDAAALIDALPRFEAWAKERRQAVKRYVKERGEVQLPGGLVYALTPSQRETVRLDVKGAIEALRSVLKEHTDEALTIKASKESIERAAKVMAAGKRGEVGRIKKEAVEALRKAGALKVSTYDDYEVREPALPAKTGTE